MKAKEAQDWFANKKRYGYIKKQENNYLFHPILEKRVDSFLERRNEIKVEEKIHFVE